jgi:hypothetical protein
MFFFGPLHVLFIYGLKRAGAILERDHEVFEEIQRQAAKVPPTQRQAVIDAMKKNRAQLEREAVIRLQEEERALNARHRRFYLIFWAIAIPLVYFVWGHDLAQWWNSPNFPE